MRLILAIALEGPINDNNSTKGLELSSEKDRLPLIPKIPFRWIASSSWT